MVQTTFDFNTSDELHTSVADGVAATIANDEAGYAPAPEFELKPILELPPIESFDYAGALQDMSATQLLDSLAADPEYRGFDITGARQAIGDDQLVGNLIQQQEKGKVVLAKSKAQAAGLDNDFKLGAAKAATGIRVMAEDLNPWGDQETVDKLQDFAEDMERARTDKDFFSLFTAGDMVAQVSALPIAAQGRLATFALEGVLGYANTRATEDKVTSGGMGVLSGSIGAGIAHFLGKFNGKAVNESLDKLKSRYLTTPESREAFKDFYGKWSDTVRVDPKNIWKGNYPAVNETAALVDFVEEGGELISKAADTSIAVEGTVRNIKQQRMDVVNRALEDVELPDLHEAGKALQDAMDTISTDFGRVIEDLGVIPTDNSSMIAKAGDFSDAALAKLDEATQADLRALKELLEDDTVNSLVEANKHLNALIRRTSKNHRAKKYDLVTLRKAIDEKLMDTLSTSKFAEWKAMNKDYAMMANVRDSKVHQVLKSVKDKEITAEQGLRDINKVTGKQLFTDIETMIGTEAAEKLELATIKEAFSNGKSATWGELVKQVDGKGFVTPEGKALREVVQRFSELFQLDKLSISGYNSGDLMQGGAKVDMINQFKGSMIHAIWTSIQSRNPLSTTGKRGADMRAIEKVLKNPQQLINFLKKSENLKPAIVQRFIASSMAKLPQYPTSPPAVHYNPKPGVNSSPVNPVFKAQMKSQAIEDGLEEAFKDAMFSKLNNKQKNQITETAYKFFDGTRFPEKIAKLGKAMKEGKDAHNAKMLQAGIKGEAELMARAIEKEHGVKVDKKMMETLIEYVTKNAMKDCK